MTDNFIAVQYLRNADPNEATAAIRVEGRNDIQIGGYGLVTNAELATLQGRGTVLRVIDEKDTEGQDAAKAAAYPAEDTSGPEPITEDLTVEDLRGIADDEGVDLTGLSLKEDIANAILAHRSSQLGVGVSTLPATVTSVGTATGTPDAAASISPTPAGGTMDGAGGDAGGTTGTAAGVALTGSTGSAGSGGSTGGSTGSSGSTGGSGSTGTGGSGGTAS